MTGNTYTSKTQQQITYYVNARQKKYLNSTGIYSPNNAHENSLDNYYLTERGDEGFELKIPG